MNELADDEMRDVAGGSRQYELNPPSSMDVYRANPIGVVTQPGFSPDVQEFFIY